MKNYFVFCCSICLAMIVSSCQNNKKIIEALHSERDSLMTEVADKEAQFNELNTYVETLALSLDSLNMTETTLLLSTHTEDGVPLSKKDIKKNIEIYEQILERQKNRILSLLDTLDARDNRISQFTGIITFLNKELEDREAQIEVLKKDLEAKNRQVAKLNKDISDLNEINRQNIELISMQETAIKTQDDVINTGYFCVGTKKELQSKGVITKTISPSITITDFSRESFTPVDMRTFTEITLQSKRIKIISPTAADSYTIVTNPDKTVTIVINDPAAFWSLSNYLVIQKL